MIADMEDEEERHSNWWGRGRSGMGTGTRARLAVMREGMTCVPHPAHGHGHGHWHGRWARCDARGYDML